ncbi:MAG: Zn-dependent alcohol dehydrogenase [Thermomicrobiales bacterium]|nr:Zn-dependent alcohol dehydrogenase [Thermomicrobiales bacterium]
MRTIMAGVLYEPNQPIRVEQVDLDDPRDSEVLVRIAASGVCRSDLHAINGEWRMPLPMVLGHEASGTVEAVGPGVTRVAPGDPVILSFAPNCGQCRYCVAGQPHLCETMRGYPAGTLPGGGTRLSSGGQPVYHFARTATMAEYAVVHESAAIPIPSDVSLEMAALVGCSVTTGIGAVINTAGVEPGSTVAVIGCGGVGLNIVQGARLANASQIIAVDISEPKLELARRFGATDDVDAREADPVRRIRELTGGGVDYAFEALGTGPTVRVAFDCLRPGGTAVVAGMAPDGVVAEIDARMIALTEKKLKGSFYGSARVSIDMPRLLTLAKAGKVDLESLVTRRYPLDEINEAYAALDRGDAGRGLIVFD